MFDRFVCGRDCGERFWYLDVVLHVFVNMNNQHVSKQTACFISESCRMFLRWFFDVFGVFATSANGNGNGCDEFEMNSIVLNSSSTVASLLVGKDAWFASCRCLLQEGTARQEEAQHSMLHVNCM